MKLEVIKTNNEETIITNHRSCAVFIVYIFSCVYCYYVFVVGSGGRRCSVKRKCKNVNSEWEQDRFQTTVIIKM